MSTWITGWLVIVTLAWMRAAFRLSAWMDEFQDQQNRHEYQIDTLNYQLGRIEAKLDGQPLTPEAR